MNKIRRVLFMIAFAILAVGDLGAQTWNSYAGGYNGGYGTIWKNQGSAMLSQVIQANANAWRAKNGLANSARNSRNNGTRNSNRTNTAAVSNSGTAPKKAVSNYTFFKPDATVNTARLFAESLGETAEEKALLRNIYTTTKAAYEKETLQKGWKNNIAGAMTFFIASAVTVYHDGTEPSEEGMRHFFITFSDAINQTPGFGQISNSEKQAFYNKLIGFSGLLIAGYTEGKQSGNEETIKAYGKIAGMLFEMILGTRLDNVKVVNGYIEFR